MPYEYGQIILVPVADGHGDGNRDATGRKPGATSLRSGGPAKNLGGGGLTISQPFAVATVFDLSEALV